MDTAREVIPTSIKYQGKPVQITKGFVGVVVRGIPGFSWRVFIGEDYHYPKIPGSRIDDLDAYLTFDTKEDAFRHAKMTVANWKERDAELDRQSEEYKALLRKTFRTEELAIKGGCSVPKRFTCDECGGEFWAQWRVEKYRNGMTCPYCDADDATFVHME